MRGLCETHAYTHTRACDYSYVIPAAAHAFTFGRVTRWSCEHKIQHSLSHTALPPKLSVQTKGNPQGNPGGSVGGTSHPPPCNFSDSHCTPYCTVNTLFRAIALVDIWRTAVVLVDRSRALQHLTTKKNIVQWNPYNAHRTALAS